MEMNTLQLFAEKGTASVITSHTKAIGEIMLQGNKPLLKMWNVSITEGERPFTKHSHTRFEITVVNEGRGEYKTENAAYPMLPGDVFVFASNEVHCITKAYDSELSITNLHFEPRYLIDNNQIDHGDDFFSFCFSHSPSFQNRIPHDKAYRICHNHSMIKQELTEQNKNYTSAIRAYLELILVELLRAHNYISNSASIGQTKISNMLAIYDHIDKHIDEELTLHTLASIAGLSPNYFSHIFKQLNGISLWDYITTKRIEKAIKLITSSDPNLTMLEIALQCGFHNTVNFNKAFKKQKGFTPSELKKDPKLLSH